MFELKVTVLKSFSEKAKGLLGAMHAYPILFKTRFGIHTIGLTFSLDVLILNKENRVVKLAKDLKPLRIFIWPPRYDTVIELPAGNIEANKIKIGDVIKIT